MIQEHFWNISSGSESTEMVHDEEGTRTHFDPETRRLVVIHPGQTTSSRSYRYQHSEGHTSCAYGKTDSEILGSGEKRDLQRTG